jgi:hypothetical protein
MSEETRKRHSLVRAALVNLPYAIVVAGAIAWCVWKRPISWSRSHKYAFMVSLAAVGLTFAFIILRRWNPKLVWPWRWRKHVPAKVASRALFTLLISACIFSVFNYYKFNPEVLLKVRDYMDVIYYYTNSKYFDELGHFDLYPAILVADQEGANRLRNIRSFRDLHTYDHVRRDRALTEERIKEIKGKFTPERWESFKNDVDFLTQKYRNWRSNR